MLRIELFQRKQSLSFLDKEKQHTLFIVLLIFLWLLSGLVFFLSLESLKLDGYRILVCVKPKIEIFELSLL